VLSASILPQGEVPGAIIEKNKPKTKHNKTLNHRKHNIYPQTPQLYQNLGFLSYVRMHSTSGYDLSSLLGS